MDDAEPTKAADVADSESEQTSAIADGSETAAAELAWSAATEEQETEAISEKRSRALWLGPAMALLAAAIAVASVLLFYVHRAPAPKAPAPAPPSASARPAPPPQAAPPAPPTAISPSPPTTKAQDPDSRFVSILKAQGWVFSVSDAKVASEGHGVCRDLAGGYTFDQEVDGIATGSGIVRPHALRFVQTAVDIFCPQYSPDSSN